MPHDLYVSWAALYEGPTDAAYFGQLIPRLLGDLILNHGKRNVSIPPDPAVALRRRSIEDVAKEACSAREAFHIVFIHADTGGRAQEADLDMRSTRYCEAMHLACCWPLARCIPIEPRHETEAWILADPEAGTEALGYRGTPGSIGLPADATEAERLVDPKAVLSAAMARIRGRRRSVNARQIASAIAQRQSLDRLRGSKSFAAFEEKVRDALADLGAI